MAFFIVVTVMSFDFFDLKDISDTLTWIFMIFPHFSLAHSLNKLYTVYSTDKACNMLCKMIQLPLNCTRELQCLFAPMCCGMYSIFNFFFFCVFCKTN